MLVAIVVVVHTIGMVLELFSEVDSLNFEVDTATIAIPGFCIILLLGASIYAIINGRNLWENVRKRTQVRFKTYVFIGSLVILGLFLPLILSALFLRPNAPNQLGTSIALLLLLFLLFIFRSIPLPHRLLLQILILLFPLNSSSEIDFGKNDVVQVLL